VPNTILKFVLPLLVLSVAVPESEAKRMGGGRSTGRQVQGVKKSAPAARSVQPRGPQQAPPAANRQIRPDDRIAGTQTVPQTPQRAPSPPPPTQTLPRQAASPWGGMLGGALIGLGLGSLISRDGNASNQPDRQADGTGSGSSASDSSGASGDYENAPAAAQAAPEAARQTASVFRTLLPVGLLALIIYFAVRRMRRRNP
jgi:hypothetical protein